MATFQKAPKEVGDMAASVLREFSDHEGIIKGGVKIDFIFAFGARNDDGELTGDALKQHGVKALGIAKIVSLKDRAKGFGDAEILIDGDWWAMSSKEERRALLDHELHHLAVKANKAGVVQTDDLQRPILKMRRHDYQFGWFAIIAKRHGQNSQECQQAKHIMDMDGQLFWVNLLPGVEKA